MAETSVALRPAVPHICIPGDEPPFLQGAQCGACQEVFVGARENCAKCGARGRMVPRRLSETGRIHTYSIVHRSFPGVQTPFVSAVVALDGGGSVQATVRDVPTNVGTALFGLPVQLVFAACGQNDRSGAPFLAYHFTPTAMPQENAA